MSKNKHMQAQFATAADQIRNARESLWSVDANKFSRLWDLELKYASFTEHPSRDTPTERDWPALRVETTIVSPVPTITSRILEKFLPIVDRDPETKHWQFIEGYYRDLQDGNALFYTSKDEPATQVPVDQVWVKPPFRNAREEIDDSGDDQDIKRRLKEYASEYGHHPTSHTPNLKCALFAIPEWTGDSMQIKCVPGIFMQSNEDGKAEHPYVTPPPLLYNQIWISSVPDSAWHAVTFAMNAARITNSNNELRELESIYSENALQNFTPVGDATNPNEQALVWHEKLSFEMCTYIEMNTDGKAVIQMHNGTTKSIPRDKIWTNNRTDVTRVASLRPSDSSRRGPSNPLGGFYPWYDLPQDAGNKV